MSPTLKIKALGLTFVCFFSVSLQANTPTDPAPEVPANPPSAEAVAAACGELLSYGFDLNAFAERMDVIGGHLTEILAGDTAATQQEFIERFAGHVTYLAEVMPSILVVLGEQRAGHDVSWAVANFAHNFRNSMASLSYSLTTIHAELKGKYQVRAYGASKHDYLTNVRETVIHLAQSARSGPGTLTLTDVPATKFLDRLTALPRQLLPEDTRIESIVEDAATWTEVILGADEALIVDTFTNIITNADAEMKKSGGKEFSVEVRSERITPGRPVAPEIYRPVVPTELGEHMVIVFTDTGGGMVRARMPEFWNGTSTKGELGNGIGLRHVAWVVREHKGFIECSEEPGVGTRIVIGLPIFKRREEKAAPALAARPAARVVFVNEVREYAESPVTFIQGILGKEAEAVTSPKDALALLTPGQRQVFFVNLPSRHGGMVALIRDIRRLNPQAKIYVTSVGLPSEFSDSKGLPIDGWLENMLWNPTALTELAAKHIPGY